MSIQTFKKKSINKYSTATKISGKPVDQYWLNQGPYGGESSINSISLKAGSTTYGPGGTPGMRAGFSLKGSFPGFGQVGKTWKMSKVSTPYRGIHPIGFGGTKGRYPISVVLGVCDAFAKGRGTTSLYVKPGDVSMKTMISQKHRWINSGQYPNYWVQPNYTGNQTDSSSQGLYVETKSAQNDCVVDTNDIAKYIGYIKANGPFGCQATPARGYTFSIQQSNAPYTKGLRIPQTASQHTTRIQRKCANPIGPQKPFPYAVQTGTGVLTGGIAVNNIANACNTSPYYITPPDWYTAVKPGTNIKLSKDEELRRNNDLIKKLLAAVLNN